MSDFQVVRRRTQVEPGVLLYGMQRSWPAFDWSALSTVQIVGSASGVGVYFDRRYAAASAEPIEDRDSWARAIAKLNDLLILGEGWDGRQAAPPSVQAVRTAEAVLAESHRQGRFPDRIVADVDGGVALYFLGGHQDASGGHSRHFGVLIDNEGEGAYYKRESGRPQPRASELITSAEGLRAILAEMVAFLGA